MSEKLKKDLENLTEADLKKVVGGFTPPDETGVVCPECGSPNAIPMVTINMVYCNECKKTVEMP